METERKLLKIPLGFRSKIPRRGIYEYVPKTLQNITPCVKETRTKAY